MIRLGRNLGKLMKNGTEIDKIFVYLKYLVTLSKFVPI